MRRQPVSLALAALLLAGTATADVRLAIGKDGTKTIYNVGANGSSRGGGDFVWLAKQRNRTSQYDAIIERHAAHFHVDAVLVRAVIQVESNFNPMCVSNKGARGLMQLMPETARRFGVKRVHDPDDNIRGGVQYLSELLAMFSYDLPRTLAAYNAGENAVIRHKGIPPYGETMTYVKRALTVYYGTPYGQAPTSYAGRRGARKPLGGGFGQTSVALTVLPNMRYLGAVGR
ncbi:MAG: lytic transglycosylase [Acidobacteria bacterium]|nr:lytic transglycosylase [Acidobacteriota bacterium]